MSTRRTLTDEERTIRKMRRDAIRERNRPPSTHNTGDPDEVARRLEAAEARHEADPKRGIASSGDPLGILASSKVKKQVSKAKAGLVREPALAHLLRGPKPLPLPLYRVALDVHHLWMTAQGQMRTSDWMQERVDGGGMRLDVEIVGALDADRQLRRALAESRMGEEAEAIVLAICGEGMTITGYAVQIEMSDAARANGGCSEATRDYVRRQLRQGLARLGRDGTMKGDSAVGPEMRRIKAWIAIGARVDIGAARLGNRDELVRPGGTIHRRA